jgi:hypothetical protein
MAFWQLDRAAPHGLCCGPSHEPVLIGRDHEDLGRHRRKILRGQPARASRPSPRGRDVEQGFADMGNNLALSEDDPSHFVLAIRMRDSI